jgi:hypothetical protein
MVANCSKTCCSAILRNVTFFGFCSTFRSFWVSRSKFVVCGGQLLSKRVALQTPLRDCWENAGTAQIAFNPGMLHSPDDFAVQVYFVTRGSLAIHSCCMPHRFMLVAVVVSV